MLATRRTPSGGPDRFGSGPAAVKQLSRDFKTTAEGVKNFSTPVMTELRITSLTVAASLDAASKPLLILEIPQGAGPTEMDQFRKKRGPLMDFFPVKGRKTAIQMTCLLLQHSRQVS
jgi:hypothetical protein